MRPSGARGSVLAGKGVELWPTVRALLAWGDEHYSDVGPRRVVRHAADDGEVTADGVCAACGAMVGAAGLVIAPGRGLAARPPKTDPVSVALNAPHRLLQPVR